jgi:dihydrofolate reductase
MESRMSKVVIEMTMSLDGFVAGPEDGKANPLGKHGGMHIFDWYFYGTEEYRDPRFLPEPGTNREEVERLFADSGAFIFGRRRCEITNGWGGRHPVDGAPVFVLTHNAPKEYPNGTSRLTLVTDGIASAIRQSQEVAGGKNIKLGGASPGKQALAAGLCDEIVVHLAPYLPRSTTTRGITHPPERSAIPRSALTTLFGGVVFRIL